MSSDRSSLNTKEEHSSDSNKDQVNSILQDYQNLLEIQADERQELLEKIDKLAQRTEDVDNIDSRLEQFSALLLDIRQQIAALTKTSTLPLPNTGKTKKPKIVASDEEIESLSKEVEQKNKKIDNEVESLVHLLEQKKEEIQQKDVEIEKLNDKLDMLTDEKSRLADELENMNSIIDSWKEQLNLLQKLAESDPRYKLISALKKHGTLSDIQLAFTMGTSINQLRKHLEDLIALELIKRDSSGRYVWTGKEFEDTLK